MPDTLKSNVRLFADDTIVYLTISAWTDCHAYTPIRPTQTRKVGGRMAYVI
jgi:hypothetical protein